MPRRPSPAAAADHGEVLQRGLDDYLSKLTAVHAFYDSSVEVDRSEFERFTGHILHDENSVMRITWSPYVTGAEREAFVRKVRRSGDCRTSISRDLGAEWGVRHVAPERSVLFPGPVLPQPDPNLRPVIGLDLASEPARREAARAGARWRAHGHHGRHAPAGRFRPTRAASSSPSPVYRPGMPHQIGGGAAANTPTASWAAASGPRRWSMRVLQEAKLPGGIDLYLFAADAKGESAPELTRALPAMTEPLPPRSQSALASLPHWQGRDSWRAMPAGP